MLCGPSGSLASHLPTSASPHESLRPHSTATSTQTQSPEAPRVVLGPGMRCVRAEHGALRGSEPPIKPDADAVHAAQAKGQKEERLLVQTVDFGHNSGRPYIHRLPDNDAKEWLELLHTQVRLAKRVHHQKVPLLTAALTTDDSTAAGKQRPMRGLDARERIAAERQSEEAFGTRGAGVGGEV